jgi:hypothetical protein
MRQRKPSGLEKLGFISDVAALADLAKFDLDQPASVALIRKT